MLKKYLFYHCHAFDRYQNNYYSLEKIMTSLNDDIGRLLITIH